MVKITHPSMRRGRDTSVQNSPQTYVVEDASDTQDVQESQDTPENASDDIDERLKQFESKSESTSYSAAPLPNKSESKKTLEDLLFVGKVEKEFDIAGNKYSLSTLTNKEHNKIVQELYNFGQTSDLFIIKSLTLALALKSINGVRLDNIEVDGEFDDETYRRKEIIDNLQVSVVEKLYSHYSSIVEESEKLVAGEDLKK